MEIHVPMPEAGKTSQMLQMKRSQRPWWITGETNFRFPTLFMVGGHMVSTSFFSTGFAQDNP